MVDDNLKYRQVRLELKSYEELKRRYPGYSIAKSIDRLLADNSDTISQKEMLKYYEELLNKKMKEFEARLKKAVGEF